MEGANLNQVAPIWPGLDWWFGGLHLVKPPGTAKG